MDTERLSQARAEVQDAESRARVLADPETRREWEAEAARRRSHLRSLEMQAEAFAADEVAS
jgi:hypothetical protein